MANYEIIGDLKVGSVALLKVHKCTVEATVTLLYGDVSVTPNGGNEFSLQANTNAPAAIQVDCCP